MLNRVIRVTIGSKVIVGTGAYDGFKVSFSVQKTLLGSPNMAQVTITNLSRDTRSIIRERQLPMTIEVGHEDTEMIHLFSGTTTSAIPSQSGPDVNMDVTAMDGAMGIIYSTQQITYDGPFAVATVVEELAGTMEGVEIGTIDVIGNLKEKGRSLSGPTQQLLDTLANEYGFSWSVQDGIFQAVSDVSNLPGYYVVSPETGLQSAQPLLSGPFMVQSGVEIQALMNPRLKPGELVALSSNLDPSLNGEYKIHNVDFAGETHGESWDMSLQSFTIGGVW